MHTRLTNNIGYGYIFNHRRKTQASNHYHYEHQRLNIHCSTFEVEDFNIWSLIFVCIIFYFVKYNLLFKWNNKKKGESHILAFPLCHDVRDRVGFSYLCLSLDPKYNSLVLCQSSFYVQSSNDVSVC